MTEETTFLFTCLAVMVGCVLFLRWQFCQMRMTPEEKAETIHELYKCAIA